MQGMCYLLPLWPLVPTSWPVEKTISGIGSSLKLEDMKAAKAERDGRAGQAGVTRAGICACTHITMCLEPPTPQLLIKPAFSPIMPIVPEPTVLRRHLCLSAVLSFSNPLLHVSYRACDVNTVWTCIDCLFLGLLCKWPRCCYLCWCTGLRGRSQKAEHVCLVLYRELLLSPLGVVVMFFSLF